MAAPQADFAFGMGRAMRAMALFTSAKTEYETSLEGLEGEEYDTKLREIHQRTAEKALEVAKENKGIYIKAAQFIAALQGGAGDHGIPKEYVNVLQALCDHAPTTTFEAVEQVLVTEFGKGSSEKFRSFDKEPLAAASLAQVHRAVTHEGVEVAVKVQHPGLWEMMASDFGVFTTMAASMKPGGFDLSWLVQDFQVSLTAELDFKIEANNAIKVAEMLKHRSKVKVPVVYPELSTAKVLTMEFVKGVRVNDLTALKDLGLHPADVADTLSSTFAEMALCHGFVHGDPHAGNVYARAHPETKEAQIIIMDHGLYHLMDDAVRLNFCSLLISCILRRSKQMQVFGEKFAGQLYRYFPLILSPWFIFGTKIGYAELLAAKDGRLPPDVELKDVGDFLVGLHDGGTNFLGVLHSIGYTRGLLNDLQWPERRRIKALGEFAVRGKAHKRSHPGSKSNPGAMSRLWLAFSVMWVVLQTDFLALKLTLLLFLSKPFNQAFGGALVAAIAIAAWFYVNKMGN